MDQNSYIVDPDSRILVTGSNGFIGTRVVKTLLSYGFRNLRCLVRHSSNLNRLEKIISVFDPNYVEILVGNLLSREDCEKAVRDAAVVYHLAAGIDKSFPGAYMNSVVATRNLLEAVLQDTALKRFVNVSSFAVYSNLHMKRHGLLDETCELEKEPDKRGEAYCYGKVKQEELLLEYCAKHRIPYVILRPGVVFGPGKKAITGRVGIDTFGFFIHLGGKNQIPFTYVDNCAEAIVLAGLKKGIDGQVFNVVDDDLPTSRKFLKLYKQRVKRFRSIYVPYRVFYTFCFFWEKYSYWSKGQLPPVFNRKRCAADWKGNTYSNEKLKTLLDWKPKVPMKEAMERYFAYQRETGD